MAKESDLTDLPLGTGYGFLVIRPKIQPGLEKDCILQNREKIFNDLMELKNISHCANIDWNPEVDSQKGKPSRYKVCGGNLTFNPSTKDLRDRDAQDIGKMALTCSECDIDLGVRVNKKEMQNILLHLMIKQMIPDFASGNFLNCDLVDNLQGLGLIAIADQLVYGHNHYFTTFPHGSSLAFILIPGLNTLSGFDGLDLWLRFLINKKMEFLKNTHQEMTTTLLGPKLKR